MKEIKKIKKISLNKETIRKLDNTELEQVQGGRWCALTYLPCDGSAVPWSEIMPSPPTACA